jgi:hypothetical protein
LIETPGEGLLWFGPWEEGGEPRLQEVKGNGVGPFVVPLSPNGMSFPPRSPSSHPSFSLLPSSPPSFLPPPSLSLSHSSPSFPSSPSSPSSPTPSSLLFPLSLLSFPPPSSSPISLSLPPLSLYQPNRDAKKEIMRSGMT